VENVQESGLHPHNKQTLPPVQKTICCRRLGKQLLFIVINA